MSRTYVVTGSGSGIGKATADLLSADGHRVIGVDLRDANILADLATPEGRTTLAHDVERVSDGHIDAVIAVAGIAGATPLTVKINYFGAVATLQNLRPLLVRSAAPRAAVVSSFSALQTVDDAIVAACLDGDEEAACRAAGEVAAEGLSTTIYSSSKRAISRWVRQIAVSPEWAGAGIPLNAVGPGIVISPMTQPMLDNDEQRAALLRTVPMPLHGPSSADAPAALLRWLTATTNTHVTGQVIFVDGGADASLRGDDIFGQ